MNDDVTDSCHIARLVLSAVVASSGLSTLSFDIFFSIILGKNSSLSTLQVLAIITSILCSISLTHVLLLLRWQVKNSQTMHPFYFRLKREHTCILSGLSSILGALTSIGSMLLFTILLNRIGDLHKKNSRIPTHNLVIGALVSSAVYLVFSCIYIIFFIYFQSSTNTHQNHEPERSWEGKKELECGESCSDFSLDSEMTLSKSCSKTIAENIPLFGSPASPESVMESRSLKSMEEYCSTPNHSQYIASTGFTSYIRRGFGNLETIPGSPTNIDSSNLCHIPTKSSDPPQSLKKNRSFNPAANSYRYPGKYPRPKTSISPSNESHIHPLFRTDSSSPPPKTTPGTVVTAAPGAGLIIFDAASICSLRNRKGDSASESGIEMLAPTEENKGPSEVQRAENWDATSTWYSSH